MMYTRLDASLAENVNRAGF